MTDEELAAHVVFSRGGSPLPTPSEKLHHKPMVIPVCMHGIPSPNGGECNHEPIRVARNPDDDALSKRAVESTAAAARLGEAKLLDVQCAHCLDGKLVEPAEDGEEAKPCEQCGRTKWDGLPVPDCKHEKLKTDATTYVLDGVNGSTSYVIQLTAECVACKHPFTFKATHAGHDGKMLRTFIEPYR